MALITHYVLAVLLVVTYANWSYGSAIGDDGKRVLWDPYRYHGKGDVLTHVISEGKAYSVAT